MENSKLTALIQLLDDNDPQVYRPAQKMLLLENSDIIPNLELFLNNKLSKTTHQRIQNIIHSIHFRNLTEQIKEWAENSENQIEQGLFLFTQYRYPKLEFSVMEKEIATISAIIELEINEYLTPLQKIRVVNHVLYDVMRFSSSSNDDFSPERVLINDVIKVRKGNHIALSAIYLWLAKNAKLPVYGVNLPRNFILAFVDKNSSNPNKENDILFYINPFNKGAVLSSKEIDAFLKKSKIQPKADFFNPCNNNTIIGRLFSSLSNTYRQIGKLKRVAEIEKILSLLDFHSSDKMNL
jgi:regulator of sirC expression with transglutaminase-like and TPR domain